MIEAQKVDVTIVRMTGLLQGSRSGFYKWRASGLAGPSPVEQRRILLNAAKIRAFHDASDHVFRSPRILVDLREDCMAISPSRRWPGR